MRHRRDHKREEKKIEGVQRPSQKASDKRIALIPVEQFEEPDRFHASDLVVDQIIAKRGMRRLSKCPQLKGNERINRPLSNVSLTGLGDNVSDALSCESCCEIRQRTRSRTGD